MHQPQWRKSSGQWSHRPQCDSAQSPNHLYVLRQITHTTTTLQIPQLYNGDANNSQGYFESKR